MTDYRDPSFTGTATGPAIPASTDPRSEACHKAWQAAYAAAVAAGARDSEARVVAAKAHATRQREWDGLPPADPADPYEDPSKVAAWGGKKRRNRRR